MLKSVIQSSLGCFGLEVRRLASHHVDAYADQVMLLKGKPVRSVFDLGASEGETAGYYRRFFPEAHVYAFEPTDAPYARLAERFKSDPKLTPVCAAVGQATGSATLFLNAFNQTNSLLPNADGASSIVSGQKIQEVGQKVVQVIALDCFCADKQVEHIDILKMDIQGFELNALRGARGLLEANRVELIYCEVLFADLYKGQSYYHEIAGYLQPLGYELYGLYALMRARNGALGWADAIFLSPQLRRRLR